MEVLEPGGPQAPSLCSEGRSKMPGLPCSVSCSQLSEHGYGYTVVGSGSIRIS